MRDFVRRLPPFIAAFGFLALRLVRIAVNMRFVLPGRLEGIGWYSLETATRMAQQHPEHEFHFLFDRPFSAELIRGENIVGHVIPPPARHPLLWLIWFEGALPRVLRRIRADVFFSPDGYCSLRSVVPTLMVMHDLAFEHFSGHVPALVERYYRFFSPRYARRAERIATVSEATRQDLIQTYGISPDKIDVVYNGSNARYSPLTPEEKEAARQAYGRGSTYFIYVGSIHPRKNLVRLLQAFDQFAAGYPGHRLLVAGRMAWKTGPVRQWLQQMEHRDRVDFCGHLEPEALRLALGGATALLYPSLFEGFGIPILEAFYAEVPVLTSNRSSMPEVAGDAALLVNPEEPREMANAMLRLAREPELREQLIAAGKLQRSHFHWDLTAQRTWAALEKVLPSLRGNRG